MRRVLWLLSFIALLAVLLVGFMVMHKQNGGTLITHNFQRIIPDTRTNTPAVPDSSGVKLSPIDPDDDLAQAPVAPPPVMTPPAAVQPNSVQSQTPTYTPPAVDTIDASSPPSSPPTPVSPNQTSPRAAAEQNNAKSAASDQSTAKAEPNDQSSSKSEANGPQQEKTAKKDVTDTSSTFDSHGIFTLQKNMHKNGYHDNDPAVLVVDKGAHFTYVLQNQDGKVVIVDRVSNAVGKADTPSPPGPYKVSEIKAFPTWIPPKSIDPDQKPVKPYNVDSHNPLGVEIIRLNKFGVALHGTNNPRSIRTDASHGCVRHSNEDIKTIASMARRGTTVIITDQFAGTKVSKAMFGSR